MGAINVVTVAVHPHGRGDNMTTPKNFFPSSGSPPRAWGQPPYGRFMGEIRRFTPTGVGTTPAACRNRPRRPVHPHGRGDNKDVSADEQPALGSPPRAWGQLRPHRASQAFNRFTPTGVGTMISNQ